jgi:hypothetical protein
MKNKIEEVSDFFFSSNLNNILFYIFCPTYSDEEKIKISDIIVHNKGVSDDIKLY